MGRGFVYSIRRPSLPINKRARLALALAHPPAARPAPSSPTGVLSSSSSSSQDVQVVNHHHRSRETHLALAYFPHTESTFKLLRLALSPRLLHQRVQSNVPFQTHHVDAAPLTPPPNPTLDNSRTFHPPRPVRLLGVSLSNQPDGTHSLYLSSTRRRILDPYVPSQRTTVPFPLIQDLVIHFRYQQRHRRQLVTFQQRR